MTSGRGPSANISRLPSMAVFCMSFDTVKALVDDDLREVDRVIRTRLASDVLLINQVADYIVGSGGKRLRPLVVVVAARACGSTDRRHSEAAAIIECIHTATLL